MSWRSGLIKTPAGPYTPETDNLVAELVKAARFAGLAEFRVFANGTEVLNPSDLTVRSIQELQNVASVQGLAEDAELAEVSGYDRAGR